MEEASGSAQEMWDLLLSDVMIDTIIYYGTSILGAILILIFGMWFAGIIKRSIKKGLDRSGKIDKTVTIFLSSMARYVVIAVTILAVLDQFGVETTSLIALMGAMGLAVGLALQGTLSNVAAGVMLLIFRPFKVGQFVELGGQAGSVKSITLFTTEMDTVDNVRIIVPNASVWGSSIKNFSHNDKRRIQMEFGISYDDDISKARTVIEDILKSDARSHSDPVPITAVSALADSSVNIMIRVWCDAGDYASFQWDLNQAVKERFDKENISMPYPHITIDK